MNTPSRMFPWLVWLASIAGLLALNNWTQPYEDAIALVPPVRAYYLDLIWYLDDILGPSLFMTSGVLLLVASGGRRSNWALAGLGLACIAFSLGDTADLHWVVPTGVAAESQAVSFSSWMSKVMVVITFCFFTVHAYDHLDRTAQKALLFALFLLYIDQIQMSISLDFAGYAFHVFEETLEVVTGSFVCLGVAIRAVYVRRVG